MLVGLQRWFLRIVLFESAVNRYGDPQVVGDKGDVRCDCRWGQLRFTPFNFLLGLRPIA